MIFPRSVCIRYIPNGTTVEHRWYIQAEYCVLTEEKVRESKSAEPCRAYKKRGAYTQ